MISDTSSKYLVSVVAVLIMMLVSSCGTSCEPYSQIPGIPERVWKKPTPYVDQQSGVTYSVARDGRHVIARSHDGRLLWKRNSFVDAKMKPYRVSRPRINFIDKAKSSWLIGESGSYIGIGFDSSQFGIINTETGNFRYLGQD